MNLWCLKVSVLSPIREARLFLAYTFLTDHLPPLLLLANALSSAASQSPAGVALLKGFSSWVKEISQQEAPKFTKETQMLAVCPTKIQILSLWKDIWAFLCWWYRGFYNQHCLPFVSSNIDMSVFMDLIWYGFFIFLFSIFLFRSRSQQLIKPERMKTTKELPAWYHRLQALYRKELIPFIFYIK